MKEGRYMMATKAIHKLGDISRGCCDLCLVFDCKETEDNYVGNWVEGLGFIDVKFPKNTTRELTQEEEDYYKDKVVVII